MVSKQRNGQPCESCAASIRGMADLDPFRSPELRAKFIAKYDAVLDDWLTPYEERDVDTDFATTHVIVTGPVTAPPIVLLHGAAATAAMWGPIIAPLSESYRCYCIDTITEANKCVAESRSVGSRATLPGCERRSRPVGIENAVGIAASSVSCRFGSSMHLRQLGGYRSLRFRRRLRQSRSQRQVEQGNLRHGCLRDAPAARS